MASIRKRTWTNKSGTHTTYEITYVIDGKQYRKSGYKTKLEAQLELPKIVQFYESDLTFLVLAKEYIERHCKINCKQSTIETYEKYLMYLEKIHKVKAKELKKRDIESVILELIQKGCSNTFIGSIVGFAKIVMNYGISCDLLKFNPIAKVKKPKKDKKDIKYLNEQQIQVFMEVIKGLNPTYYAFFSTALLTGMRKGELLALEWKDINFKTSTISVNKQLYNGVITTPKTGKTRIVDIPNNLKSILQEYKHNDNILSKYVFHLNKGKYINESYLRNFIFKPLIRKCNEVLPPDNQINNFAIHDLRHTYATYLLSKSVPVKYVQKQLGHSTAKMTLDVYSDVMPSVKYGSMELLEEINNFEHNLSTAK